MSQRTQRTIARVILLTFAVIALALLLAGCGRELATGTITAMSVDEAYTTTDVMYFSDADGNMSMMATDQQHPERYYLTVVGYAPSGKMVSESWEVDKAVYAAAHVGDCIQHMQDGYNITQGGC